MIFLTIIVFILIIGLLVFVHELGHFLSAKRAGIRVEEFGFGLPPRLFGLKRGETIYSINLLPIGGFVKIYGESSQDRGQPRSFASCSIGKRAQILTAGVLMNLFLAAALLSLGYGLGLPTVIDEQTNTGLRIKDEKIQIIEVMADSPADLAGLKIGDEIKGVTIAGQFEAINQLSRFGEIVNQHRGELISVVVQRGSQTISSELVPRLEPPEGQGPIGIAFAQTGRVAYPWYQAIVKGIWSTLNLFYLIIVVLAKLLWQLILTGRLMIEIAGPVGIYSLTSQMAQLGLVYLIQFTAFLSVNLAIINILPFPALDGGRLLFLLIEKIKGAPLSERFERTAHTIGFIVLIILMIVITWRDILRFF